MENTEKLENPVNEEGLKSKPINIFELTKEQDDSLKERIKKWEGVVRVFIHPFYDEHGNRLESVRLLEYKHENAKNNSKLQAIKGVLCKILEMPENDTPPVIIFEEAIFIDDLLKKINANGLNKQDVVIVPTHSSSSMPYINDNKTPGISSWQRVEGILGFLGVKKIIIGGMMLEVNNEKEFNEILFEYGTCVGNAIENLRRFFDIEISSLNYPHSRLDDIHNKGSVKRIFD